ncbi:MAG: MFS transporter, partial [Pseudomonadota bacterium]
AALMVVLADAKWVIFTAQTTIGASLAFLGPLIAAMTLGIAGRAMFTKQTSANQAWNHAGNVVAAGIAAGLALAGYVSGVFFVIAVMAAGMILSTLLISSSEIDNDLARGGVASSGEGEKQPSGFATIAADKRMIIFATCVFLFHFANAAMLPLASQKLAVGSDTGKGIAFTSACIISAQFLMIPMAVLCGRTADVWGRKMLFLFAFSILPIRGVLYTLTDNSYLLVAIQPLDGVANGIFAVIFLLIVSDLTEGTGRFNIAQGAIATMVGIGASISNLLAEQIVEHLGYDAAFLFLAAVALVGVVVFALTMPETARHALERTKSNATPSGGGQ